MKSRIFNQGTRVRITDPEYPGHDTGVTGAYRGKRVIVYYDEPVEQGHASPIRNGRYLEKQLTAI